MKTLHKVLCMAALLAVANHTQILAQDKPLTPPTKNEVKEGIPKNQEPLPTPESGNAPPAPPYNLGQSLSPTT
jgi:hypothetical protein